MRRYLITYDISEAKRLRRTYQWMCAWGLHLQYSVFLCDMSDADRQRCEDGLREIIHHEEDQILFVDLGPSDGRGERCITSLGRPHELPEDTAFIF